MSSWRSNLLRNLSAAVLFFALWALYSAPVHAQPPPPDLDTYNAWVREAFAAAQRSDQLGLEQVAERLIATNTVQLPDGGVVAVDNGWLREALRSNAPDLEVIAKRLGAIIDALAQPPSTAPNDARERLKNILSRPPFKRDTPSAPSWLSDLLRWIVRLIERLFGSTVVSSLSDTSVTAWVIFAVGVALLLGVFGYLARGLRRGIAAEAHVNDDDPEAHLTATTALDQAGELAREGDYRTAVRYLYLSALLRLDERDLLRYDRALTNREYLERVRQNPALHTRLAPIVETFDLVWYGYVSLDDREFALYRQQVVDLTKNS